MEQILKFRVKGKQFGYNNSLQMDIEINIKSKQSGQALSISAGVWNIRKTDYLACGQMQDTIREMVKNDEIVESPIPMDNLIRLLDIWDRWHLNDMKAGCSHQRKLIPTIQETKGKSFFYADNYDNILKLKEFKRCPKCGYQYGTAWKHERLPMDIVKFLANLVEDE